MKGTRTIVTTRLDKDELDIMTLLWRYGEMKASEIQEKFPRPIKNSLLRYYLRVLSDQEHVTRRAKGNAYFYKATTPKESVV